MSLALRTFLLIHLLAGLGQKVLGTGIINGKKSGEKSLLYMASVQEDHRHICGGFLISEEFVVTAAHCGARNITSVVLGTHNLKKVNNGKMRYKVKPCKHPSFVNPSKGSDIMLLKLMKKARTNGALKTIKLATHDIKMKENQKCTVAGWGFNATGGKSVDELRVVDVPITDLNVCKKEWSQLRKPVQLPPNVICAGGYGTDKGFCKGDSGGPLVCNNKAVGIVSFNMSNNCDYPNVPNVYTNIYKYLRWIKKVLKKKTC